MASPPKLAFSLALVTVFQFMEGLTDRQEAFAVRDRLAWKDALSLELTDAGFDHTVLSEFRSRLVKGGAEQRLLDLLLEGCREGGWRKRRRASKNRLDACPGQDPRSSSGLMPRGANDGVGLECALGSGSRVGSYSCASRMGRALWQTARRGTLAQRGIRAPKVSQSSRSRRLDAAPCTSGCSHS